MKILVIDPVKSVYFENETKKYFEKFKDSDTKLAVRCLKSGPETIETYVDVVQASPEILNIIFEEKDNYDAFIINCFADPGLDAAREVSERLVLGVAETTMHIAAMLVDKFSVLTTDKNSIPWTVNQAHSYGIFDKLAGVSAVDIGVGGLKLNNSTYTKFLKQAEKELERDSEAIALGCTGMTAFAEKLQKDIKVPVLEPSKITLKVAEALIKLGITHSRFIKYSMTGEKKLKLLGK
jgi:allantoin racemase